MSTPELLKDILVTIQCLQKELAGSDVDKVNVAQEAYQELLDGFYEEYQDIMGANCKTKNSLVTDAAQTTAITSNLGQN